MLFSDLKFKHVRVDLVVEQLATQKVYIGSKPVLTLCMLGNFLRFYVVTFLKKIFRIPSVWLIVWILIRPDILSGLIWIQIVCKGYQQTTKVAACRQRVMPM